MSDQTVAALATQSGLIGKDLRIEPADRTILRTLAARVAELAARPIEEEKRELWYRHNALEPTRPLIFCDPENGWNEIITPDQLECTGDAGARWEMRLRKEIFWGDEMNDDRVIEPFFDVAHVYTETDWGMHETQDRRRGRRLLRLGRAAQELCRRPAAAALPARSRRRRRRRERLLALAQETLGDLLQRAPQDQLVVDAGDDLDADPPARAGADDARHDRPPRRAAPLMAFLRDGHLARLDYLETQRPAQPEQRRHLRRLGRLRLEPRAAGAGLRRARCARRICGASRESQETVGVSPAHVRRVRLSLPAADPGALRAELLRLLRAAGQALAAWSSASRTCGASRSRPGATSEVMAERLGRLHLLVQAAPGRPGHALL